MRVVAGATAFATITAITAVGAGSAAAHGPAAVPTAAKPTRGGSVTYGLEAETSGGWCIPNAQLVISGIMVASAIYDTLTVMNTKGQYVPYLAKTVTHDPTYSEWTIGLRDGIKFHDGTPLTADAVKQNIDAWRKGRLLGFIYTNIADVTVVDPLTVKVTTKVPWVGFDGFLFLDGRVGIAAPAQLANLETCPTNLIGTGPFMIYNGAGHWTQNQEFVAARNPNYWQKDKAGTQLPYLDKITFVPNPDPSQRTNQLEAGQLQLNDTKSGAQIDRMRGMAGIKLTVEKPGRREVRYFLLNAKKPPFDDANARKAVALALDRVQINEIRNNGLFQLADGPFDKDVSGYVKNPGFPKFNLKQARQLVQAYKDAHGGKFPVVIESTNDPENSAEGQLVKEQLDRAGFDATLQQEDQSAFVNTALGGNFSLLLWRNHPGDGADGQYVWWYTGSPINFGKFDDPALQALLDQGRSEPDAAKQKAIYQQVDKMFAQKLYNIWGYYVNWAIGYKSNVQGVAGPPIPDGGGTERFLGGRLPVVGIWLKK